MDLRQVPIPQRLHFTQRLREQVTRGTGQPHIAGTDRIKRLDGDVAQAPMFVRIGIEPGMQRPRLTLDTILAANAKGGNRICDGIIQASV